MPLGTKAGLGPGDFVLDGDPAALLKKGAEPPPQFSIVAKCLDGSRWHFGREIGLSPGHIVRDPAPLPKKGAERPPQFSAHVHYGQTAVCIGAIRIPLGKEVGLSLGDIVLDGDPAPSPLKGHSPNFRPMSVVAKRLDRLRCHLVWR